MPEQFKCINCGNNVTAFGVQPGDFCPKCYDGTLMPKGPVVFSSTRAFLEFDRMVSWQNEEYLRKLRWREN